MIRSWRFLSVLLLAGCSCGRSTIFYGGGGGGGGGPGCGSNSVDLFFTDTLAAECQALKACPFTAADADFLTSACLSQALNQTATEIAELTASVDAGRMSFDPCAATSCLPSIPALFADAGICTWAAESFGFDLPDVVYVCPNAFVGVVLDGGPCGSILDCVTGFCSNGQNYPGGFSPVVWEEGASCLGVCTPFFQLGQDCGVQTGIPTLVPTPSCEPGLVCSGRGPTCEALSPLGGPCGPYVNGCAEGYCALAPNTIPPEGTCMLFRSLGQTCSLSGYCGSACCGTGLECVGTGETGVCAASDARPLGAGEPCNEPFACALPLICAGFEFLPNGGTLTGICTLAHDVGGSCVAAPEGTSGCLGGLDCVDGECQLPPSEGACAPITSDWPGSLSCDLSHFCNLITGTCEPYLPTGASCLIVDAGVVIGGALQCQEGFCDLSGRCAVTNCGP